MKLKTRITSRTVLLTLGILATYSVAARAGDGLKTFNNPGGGQIVYGPLDSKTTMEAGMADVLRNVHGHFGEKPQIGKFFQTRGSKSVATFFTVTAKNEGGRQMAGLAIISEPLANAATGESGPEAAVIFDEAKHFAISANSMLKKLTEFWYPAGSKGSMSRNMPVAPAHIAKVQSIHPMTAPDQSAVVSLPEGWQVLQNSGGGTIHAIGPNGESLNLGVIIGNIYDLRNPKAAGLMRYTQAAHQQVVACPYGGDLVIAYRTVAQQLRRARNLPPPTITVISEQKIQPNPYEACATLVYCTMDMNEGKGLLKASIKISALKPAGNSGMWAMSVSELKVPDSIAEEEWPTMVASVHSYKQNGVVIQHQTDIVIENIHRISKDATDRSNAMHESQDRRNQSIDQTRDDQSRQSAAFRNYQFDETVVQDNSSGGHATIGYGFADMLIKSNPNRFQYVERQDFMKGHDY